MSGRTLGRSLHIYPSWSVWIRGFAKAKVLIAGNSLFTHLTSSGCAFSHDLFAKACSDGMLLSTARMHVMNKDATLSGQGTWLLGL